MQGCGARGLRWGGWGSRRILRKRWCFSPAPTRTSFPDKPFGWTADCLRARVGRIPRSHDFFDGIKIGSIGEGRGVDAQRMVEDAAVVELNAAETAVIEHTSCEAFEQVEKASVQGIDLVAVLQLLEAAGTTLRAAAGWSKM